MLPVLLAHIEHPQQGGFEDLDDAQPQQRFLAEAVDSLGPHMQQPAAQAVIKALYARTGEPLTAVEPLTQPAGRAREIYRLLEASGHLERSAASLKIDLHHCSHHLGETLTRLALRDPEAPDRVHIVYGEATHVPGNAGKMRSAVESGLRKAGFDPAGLSFPPAHLVLEKSQLQRALHPVAPTRGQDQSRAANRPAGPASDRSWQPREVAPSAASFAAQDAAPGPSSRAAAGAMPEPGHADARRDSSPPFADHEQWAIGMDEGLTGPMQEQIKSLAGLADGAEYRRSWARDAQPFSGAFLGRIEAPGTRHHQVAVFLRSPSEGPYRQDLPKLMLATPEQIEAARSRDPSLCDTPTEKTFKLIETGNTGNYPLRPTRQAGHRLQRG